MSDQRATRAFVVASVVVLGAALQVSAQTPPPNMEVYYLGLLKRGAEWKEGQAPLQEVQQGHLESMVRRWREGTLVGSGPILDGGELRGILLIRAADLDAAKAVAADDPAVKSGRLAVDVFSWWAPRGIGDAYQKEHTENPAAKDRMKKYQLAFLRRGPKWTPGETPELRALQERHLAHIRAMGEAGKLVAAGPFTDGGELRGVFVFDCTSDEARALAAQDPSVQAGRLVLDFHTWAVAEGVLPAAPVAR